MKKPVLLTFVLIIMVSLPTFYACKKNDLQSIGKYYRIKVIKRFETATGAPDWSENDQLVAFDKAKNTWSFLYLYDINKDIFTKLAKGYNPSFLGNKEIYFINPEGQDNRVFAINLATKKVKSFGIKEWYVEDVVEVSPDKKSLLLDGFSFPGLKSDSDLKLGYRIYNISTKDSKLVGSPENNIYINKMARWAPKKNTLIMAADFNTDTGQNMLRGGKAVPTLWLINTVSKKKEMILNSKQTSAVEPLPAISPNEKLIAQGKGRLLKIMTLKEKKLIATARFNWDIMDINWSNDGKKIALTIANSNTSQVVISSFEKVK